MIRNCVRQVRLRRRISVSELARRSGVSRGTVYNIERDDARRDPTGTAMFAIARALNEDVATLFWDDPQTARPAPPIKVVA